MVSRAHPTPWPRAPRPVRARLCPIHVRRRTDAHTGASSSYEQLAGIYAKSQAFKRAFKAAPSACSTSSGSLCAAAGRSLEQSAQLLTVASPVAFDAREASNMGEAFAAAVSIVRHVRECVCVRARVCMWYMRAHTL